MSKVYAMRNAGTNNGSSRQNNNGGTKKKDRFQEAYEQGTRIYEQNRSQLVQQTQQLQTQLQGIGNGPLTYQQARNVRTYYNNLQSLTTYGFDTSEQIQAIGGFARQNNKLLSTFKTEQDYNNGYLYPARYQGLSGSTNTTNQLNGLRRTIGALRQRGGDKARADALQAEYDWLEQHQYDYWSRDELDDRIKYVEGLLSDANQAVYDSGNYTQTSTGQTRKQSSGYMYDNPLGTEADHKEADAKEHAARYTAQINALKAAKESNAYRDTMAGWTDTDFKNMGELASEVTKRDEADKASTWSAMAAAFGGSPDGGLSSHAQAKSHQPRITELYSYFREKGLSNEQIDSLVSYFQRNQNMMQRQQDMQELSAFAKEHPVLASAISVPINLMSGVGYVDLALQNATAGTDAITGEKQRVDQYSALTLMGDASSTMRGAVSEDMGGFGSFLYNTGMSMADFLAAAPAGGGASELMLGGAAAMQATREAYARGASDGQALGMGAWAGASEAAFEHLSLGSLKAMKTSVTAARGTFKQILVDMAKQGFVEGSEETFTTISNTLGDAFIMGDKSALNTAIRDYMEKDGLSEAEATRKAYTDWAMNTALDFAGGALSGGVLGGGNRVRMNWAQGVQGQAILDRGQELEVINTALAMPEGSEARVFAEHLTETKMKSGDYTATEIGQLAWAVEAQRAQTKNEDNPTADMPRTHSVVTTATDGSGATVMATQMSEVAEALVAAGDTHQEALAKTKVIEAVVAGDAALTGSQINKVGFNALTAQSTVDVIKQYTGVDITANGKTASAIRKSILAARDQQAERAAQIKAQGEAIHAARAAVDAAAAQNDADAAAKATAMLDEAQAAASTGARAQVADSAAEGTGAPAETAEAPVGDTTAAATAASETAAPAGDDTLHFSNGGSLTFKEFVDAYHDANPNKAASKAELARRFGELLKAQEANGGTLPAKELRKAVSSSKTKTKTKETSSDKAPKGEKAKSDTAKGKTETDLTGKARAELEASRNTRETEKGKTVKVAEGVEFAAREGGLQELSSTQIWTGALVYRFMKNIGIKKVVYDAAYVGSDANALIEAETGTIYINPEAKGMDNRGTILWALGHEISHPATDGSKSNNALAEKILSTFEKVAKLGALKEGELQSQVVARTTTVNKTLARYKAFYEAHGNTEMAGKVDEHFASQEVAGDWIGWAFQSREIMERIGRVDPSTLNLMQRAVLRLQETVTKLQRAQARKQYGTGIGILNADADSAAEAEKIIRSLADDVNTALKKSELNQSFKAKSRGDLTSRDKMKEKAEKESGSDERAKESADRRGRKDSGRAGTGRRAWAATREAVQGQRSNDGSADLGVHGRELSPQIREIATRSGAPDLGLHESSHADFSAALDAGKAANRNGAMVDSQSVDSLAENGTTTFLAENGMAGVAIEADGNIVGVFKNPALRTNNATYDLLLTALANGGDHLDCYVLQPDVSPKNLGQLYSDLGFVPVAFLRFNREYASPDWDYERFGEPDVVMWIHNGDSVETVADKMGTYPDIYTPEYIRENCREFTDYDAAKAYQKEQLNNRNAAQDSKETGAVSASTPEIKGRFSVTEPIEYTKNLVALHNFSAMSMRRILRDGGMPTASIAVVKHDMAHTAFGDWTIVLPRESVDPQANPNNKMWGGDAYTPMVNHLEMPHAVDEDATDAIIDELVDKTGDPYYNRILSEVVLTMRRGGVDKAISDYVQNLGLDPDLRDVFNADQSEDVQAARSDPELLGATDEALRYYWPGNPVAEDMLADAAEAVDDALGTDFLEQVENGDDTAFVDFCNRVNETPAAVANWMHERFDGAVSEAPAHVMNVDRYTGEVLEEQPYTLENVVRMMYDYFPHQSFDTDPSDLQDPDLNGWQSAAVPKINSIDEAHELSDRLRKDRVEHRDKLTKLRDQLISVTKNILPFARHMSFQNVAELLSSTANAKSTSEIKNAFFKEGAILPENLAEKVLEVNRAFADLPQQYFEAKAERVIDLDEMKKGLIVAPKDAPKDLLDQVRQVFPNVVTYDTQRPETRLDAVNSPVGQNLRFQINPEFASDIDEWDQDGRKAHVIFDLGTTGEVLQSLGATEGDIRLDSEKIETILKEHPEMTLDDIKALGEIVNNPVLVLKSRNVNRSAPNTRVVMIGDHKASNGKYVLAILDLSPNNSNLRVAGMQKLSSSYTKLDTPSTPDAFRQLLKMSYVMYYDPKRAAKVLSAAGLRLRSTPDSASDKKAARELPLTGLQSRPGHYSQSGFVGSVAYQRDFVKPSEYIVKMYGAKPSEVFEDIPARRYSVTRDQFDNDEEFRAFYRDLFGGLGLTERKHADTQAGNTPPDREVSLVRSNTFDHLFTSAEKRMDELKEGEFEYDRVTEVQSMSEARERLDADYEGEREYLENHSFTNGTDLDTAMGILSVELANARETGDYTDAVDWAHVIRANGTAAGQLVQAFAKYSRTPEGVLVNAIETLEESDLDPDRQDEIIERIFEFSRTLHDIERGDEEGRGDLIDLILEQAEMRNTKVSKTTLKNLSSGQITWLYDLALAQMDQIARDFIKPSFAKGLATFQTISHLFNIRTTNRNLGSNTLFSPIAAIGNNLAIIPDAIASVFTGQRYVGFDRWIFSKATWKGMREGGAKAWVEVALDVQPEPTQRDKYGTARRTWKMTGGRAARVGSTIEKMMGYELNFTDEFHKGGIRAEIMQSLEPMVRNGVITTEMAEQWAEQEALYRAFQDDTYMGNLLAILKNGMNTIGIGHTGRKIGNLEIKEFGLGDLVQKYTQVPGALFTRAVEFSPVGYAKCLYLMAQMSSAAKESKKANAKYETLQARADASSGKDALVSRAFRAKTAAETAQMQAATAQRMFALAVGRATTGTGLLALFATLALKGVLRRADDEDDPNVKAQNLSEGITGTQLNTSALARMIRGDSTEYQTGDHLVSVDWIEPINGLMTMGALIAKDTDGDQSFADKVKSYGLNSLDGLYLAFSDLPTMQTLKTVRDTVNYYDEEDSPTGSLPLDIGIEVARGSLTGFIPSPVRQIAQATDPVQRDAYTSDSVAQQTWDQIRNSIPGLRQQLPVKKDNLGNDRKQEGGLLGVLNATFLPGNIRTYQQSEYSKEMYEVYKATGDSSFYPGKSAPYKVAMSIDGEQMQYKLDADQRVQYQRTRGATMYALIKDMHDDPAWKAATPEERAEMLSMAKNLATYAANQEVAKANGKTYTNNEYEKTNGALDVGYTVASWQNIRSAMSSVEGVDEDGDGKADDGTKKAAALQVLVDLDLTDEQKVYWYRGSSYAEETDKVGEAMAAGISANDWFSAKIALSNAHGTDNNGDGKTDSGSVQADVIRILMSMNLTPEQRRLLFLQMYPQSTKKANGTNWGD